METLRLRVEEFLSSAERVRYRAAARVGPAEDALAELDARFEDISSGDLLAGLKRDLADGGFETERDARRRLIALLESALLSARSRALSRELRGREAAQEGLAQPAEESDADRRAELQDAIDASRDELDGLREELFLRLSEVRASLGHPTGLDRARFLFPAVDFQAWAGQAQRLLGETEAFYRDALRQALRAAGLATREPQRGDLPWVHRMESFDALLPAGRLVALLDHTAASMGLGLDAVAGLRIDIAGDERGPPACFPLSIPGEIIVLGRASPGVAGLCALLRAAGRALPHAFASPELPVERRRLLDPALALGFALLLEDRAGDPEWIAEGPAQLRSEEFAAGVRLGSLVATRSTAADVAVEFELAAALAGSLPRRIAERRSQALSDATGYRHRAPGYLLGLDPELASIHRLRARTFAAQLAENLRERFGRRFWRERHAGDLLKEIWNTGGTYSAEGVAEELGFAPLDVSALIESLGA
jgi:hypothetical protein